VQNENDVAAVGPLLDFPANDLRQVRGRDVFDRVVFVDDNGGVMSKAGRQAREEKRKHIDGRALFHDRVLKLYFGE